MTTHYERHELNVMPDISGNDWKAFVAAIKTHGQMFPITLFEGKILDGWRRHRACAELGIEPIVKVFGGDDEAAFAYFLDMNLRRKNYTRDQLAMMAVELEPLLESLQPRQQALFEV